jgi:hypothetical protein
MIGDFNVPDINWETGMARGGVDVELLEAAQTAWIEQLVDFPTHIRETHSTYS